MSQLSTQAGRVPCYSWKGQSFYSIQAFRLNEGHPHQGGKPALFSLLTSIVNLIKKKHPDRHKKNMFDQISGYPVAQSS